MHRGSPRQRVTSGLTNLTDNSTCSVQSTAFQAVRDGSHLWFQAAGICSCFPLHDMPGQCPGGTAPPMGSSILGVHLVCSTCSPPRQSLSLLPAAHRGCLGNLSLNGIIFLQAVLGGSPRQSYFCTASARVLHLSELQSGPLRV